MAEASVFTPEPTLTLTLTMQEAEVLHTILRAVGGEPDASPRGHMNTTLTALENAGIAYNDNAFETRYQGLYFKNEVDL